MNKRFLPGVLGADVPITDLSEVQQQQSSVTEGNGPLAGQTFNYDFNLVNFDWITWHNYEWENWIQVDALLQAAIGFLNIRGLWRPNTDYTAGESVYDPTDVTLLYLCQQTHTSGTNFETDKPLFWELRQDANPPVASVFGRIGAIVAQAGDYSAFYPSLAAFDAHTGAVNNPHNTSWANLLGKPTTFPPSAHTHTEAQITDLDKYTKAEVDAQQGAQDSSINANANAIAVEAGRNDTQDGDISQNASDIVAVSNNLATNYFSRTQSDGRYMRYVGAWSAGTYTQWQVVSHLEATWLCISTTTDEPSDASASWVGLGSAGAGSITIGDTLPVDADAGDLHFMTVEDVGLYVYYDDGDSQQWIQTNGGGGGGDGGTTSPSNADGGRADVRYGGVIVSIDGGTA